MQTASGARPIYETDESRNREAEILRAVTEAWGVEARRLPTKSVLDAALFKGDRAVALVEVKDRTTNRQVLSTTYRRHMISAGKVMAALDHAALGIDVVLVVRFADKIVWFSLVTATFEVGWGGRVDRGDSQDMELACWFEAESTYRELTDFPAFLR